MTKVAIIGAGASGVITAKILSDKGFDVFFLKKVITLQEFGILEKKELYIKA